MLKLVIAMLNLNLAKLRTCLWRNNIADVVISNCVLNLVPNRKRPSQKFQLLKSGAHFCVSDIVIKGTLPEALQKDAEMYAGCVSGAIQQDEYLNIIKEQGFKNVEIKHPGILTSRQMF